MTMNEKDDKELLENSKKIIPCLEQVVSEGSIVVLEARDLIKNIDGNSITQYSWNQTEWHIS